MLPWRRRQHFRCERFLNPGHINSPLPLIRENSDSTRSCAKKPMEILWVLRLYRIHIVLYCNVYFPKLAQDGTICFIGSLVDQPLPPTGQVAKKVRLPRGGKKRVWCDRWQASWHVINAEVWNKDGLKGFWAGLRPNVVRTCSWKPRWFPVEKLMMSPTRFWLMRPFFCGNGLRWDIK